MTEENRTPIDPLTGNPFDHSQQMNSNDLARIKRTATGSSACGNYYAWMIEFHNREPITIWIPHERMIDKLIGSLEALRKRFYHVGPVETETE